MKTFSFGDNFICTPNKMASARILLIMLCAVSVRSQLLPIDLTALTSGILPLGGDANHRGILNTVGDILSLGVNTVGGIGHNVLGLRESEGQNQSGEDSNSGYEAQDSLINQPVNPHQGGKVNQNQRPNTPWNGYNNNGYATQAPHDNARRPPYPISSRREPEANIRVPAETKLPLDGKGNIPEANVKYNPAKDFVQAQNGIILPNNQIILPSGQQNNGVLYLPNTGLNLGIQGTNVPNLDNNGCAYYVIQAMNQLGQNTQTLICKNLLNSQGYVLMNINGQQVLVPVANLQNGLQVDTPKLLPNPGSQGPNYVFLPNNGQLLQNAIGNTPVINPVVNYVTASPYLNNDNVPAGSNVNADGGKVGLDNNIKLENTKDGSDVEIKAVGSDLPIAIY